MADERICQGPTCTESLESRHPDAVFCGASCRAEAWRTKNIRRVRPRPANRRLHASTKSVGIDRELHEQMVALLGGARTGRNGNIKPFVEAAIREKIERSQ